jgi:hypothetical protein
MDVVGMAALSAVPGPTKGIAVIDVLQDRQGISALASTGATLGGKRAMGESDARGVLAWDLRSRFVCRCRPANSFKAGEPVR